MSTLKVFTQTLIHKIAVVYQVVQQIPITNPMALIFIPFHQKVRIVSKCSDIYNPVYGIVHIKDPLLIIRKEMFYLTMHSTHFI